MEDSDGEMDREASLHSYAMIRRMAEMRNMDTMGHINLLTKMKVKVLYGRLIPTSLL